MEYSASLPNELWTEVASYLDPKDQVSLSQTNKQLACIVNRLLYKAPKLEHPDHGDHLMSLLRTLFQHPELLEQMQSLTIAITNCQVPSIQEQKEGSAHQKRLGPGGKDIRRRSPEYQAIRENLVSRLKERGITQETHPAWLGSIQSWILPAFFGGLLMLLPNLKHLGMSCHIDEENKNFRPSKGGMTEMFFGKKGLAPANYDFLQHLKIESLDFTGHFTSAFLNLPQLKRLRLDSHPNYPASLQKRYRFYNDPLFLRKLLQNLLKMVPDLEVLELKPKFEWDTLGEMSENARQFEMLKQFTVNDVELLEKCQVKRKENLWDVSSLLNIVGFMLLFC